MTASGKEHFGPLSQIAARIRISVIESLTAAGSGHLGGSLGMADIFTWLYFRQLRHNPAHPDWPERDRLILSIGHIAPVLYATLAHSGYFPLEELMTLRKLGSRLQGHPGRDHGLPGLELSAGSLGQGLSVALGMALAVRCDQKPVRIYCILGDGELQEGSVWEAAMAAGHYRLSNLTAIVDRNRLQIDGKTEDVMNLEPLREKWQAFGWNVTTCNGHDFLAISEAFEIAEKYSGKPTVILADTCMGKGVAEIENDHKWHGKVPDSVQKDRFISEIKNISAPDGTAQ